jgi:hypothetical protein
MPAGLHLNARTVQDYARLTKFIRQRAEITDVTFEFKTGGAWRSRRNFHYDQLAQLGRRVGKPMRIVMIGGLSAIPKIGPAYDKLTFIDTSAFMKAMHRQRLFAGNDGRILSVTEPSQPGEPVDALLADNVATMRAHVEHLVSEMQSTRLVNGNELMPENLGMGSSARAAHS